MIQKIYYVNIALFVVVAGMSALLLTAEYPIPRSPDPEIVNPSLAEGAATQEPRQENSPQSYSHLGSTGIFDTLYPRPTPKPTPVPTPKPDEELEKMSATWKLQAVLPGGIAMFEDSRAKDEWQMKIGETKPVKYKSDAFDIRLDSTNEAEFTAIISYTGPSGKKQTRKLSMFDE